MTVRAWFTISALVLAALAAAFVFRLFAPVTAPAIRVRAGEVTLDGRLASACWPGRGGDLRCERHRTAGGDPSELPATGTLRFSASYPVEAGDGSIAIKHAGDADVVISEEWKRSLPYELEPGRYVMTTEARYPGRAYVRYVFRFTVTRSGS